jgi:hypothetical protein
MRAHPEEAEELRQRLKVLSHVGAAHPRRRAVTKISWLQTDQ